MNVKTLLFAGALFSVFAAGARITYDLLNAKSRVEGETVNGQKTRVSTFLAPRAKNGTTQPAPRRAAPAPMTGSSRLE